MATSINGWEVLDSPPWTDERIDRKLVPVPGVNIWLTGRRDVLPLFLALAAEYHHNVAPLRDGEVWGYSWRLGNASTRWSDHSSGTAIDLNSAHEGAQGPRGGMATMTDDEIAACVAIKKKFEIVIWGGDAARGGDYHQPKNWDPMHYALKKGTTLADVQRIIKKLHIRPNGTIMSGIITGPVVNSNGLIVGSSSSSAKTVIAAMRGNGPWWRAYLIGNESDKWTARAEAALNRYGKRKGLSRKAALQAICGPGVAVL